MQWQNCKAIDSVRLQYFIILFIRRQRYFLAFLAWLIFLLELTDLHPKQMHAAYLQTFSPLFHAIWHLPWPRSRQKEEHKYSEHLYSSRSVECDAECVIDANRFPRLRSNRKYYTSGLPKKYSIFITCMCGVYIARRTMCDTNSRITLPHIAHFI